MARPENISRRRSLALDRSAHDGRLMAHRDGGACASRPAILALLVASTMIVGLSSGVMAEPPPVRPSTAVASSDPWVAPIAEAAERFAIPERWIRAVMAAASGGEARALPPRGAIGLMQVMPAVWVALRTKYDLGDDPWEPRANILAGAALLRQMHDRYGAVDAMLATYDAGPERYDAYLRTGRALPGETVAWLAKVMPMIGGEALDPPAPANGEEPSWQRAPLFVVPSAVNGNDGSGGADLPSARPSNGPPIVDLSALMPPSDGLFVRQPAAEGERR